MTFDEFIDLSEVLTGISKDSLRARPKQKTVAGEELELGEVYLNRVEVSFAAELSALATAWQEAKAAADPLAELRSRLTHPDAKNLRLAARQVIRIWYLSIIDATVAGNLAKAPKDRAQDGGDLGQYQQSVVWDVVKAHVPAYSNRQYGHWAAKPGE